MPNQKLTIEIQITLALLLSMNMGDAHQLLMISFVPSTGMPSQALLSAASLLQECRKILNDRIITRDPPSWMPPAISSYLLSLSDSDLHHCETDGFANYLNATSTKGPPALHSLASRAATLSAHFPVLQSSQSMDSTLDSPGRSNRRCKKRPKATKRAQIRQLAALTSHLLSHTDVTVERILDVGAGHAHLASSLATQLPFAPPVLALDRDEALIRAARDLHAPLLAGPIPPLTLSCTSIGNTSLTAQSTDLLLGLHACGALGDAIIQCAASDGPASVVLVSCCLQKIAKGDQNRVPMSSIVLDNANLREALTMPRGTLGATNRTRGYVNRADITARETRYALRQLLEARGQPVQRAGEEVYGLSRHRLRKGLREVAGEVLAMRNISGEKIKEDEILEREQEARSSYRVMRALTLPRSLAGEVMEMAIILDRAAVLEECGRFSQVRTCRVWGDSVSVRNLGCVAWREGT